MKLHDYARYIDAISADLETRQFESSGTPRLRAGVVGITAATGAAAIAAALWIAAPFSDGDSTQVATEPLPGATAPAPTGEASVTAHPPGQGELVVVLTDEALGGVGGNPSVAHQIGVHLDGYGYDAMVFESDEHPIDPCTDAQPCSEVATPTSNAAGFTVRYWAPTLVPGTPPSKPVSLTVEGPDWTLAINTDLAGAPVDPADLVENLVVTEDSGGRRRFVTSRYGIDHEFETFSTTIVSTTDETGSSWAVSITPECSGAEACIDGHGVTSLAAGDISSTVPAESLVSSVTSS